jgi:hypothetical protein
MTLRLSKVEAARARLDEQVKDADANRDGRVTSAELSTALRGATPEAKSALFSAWRDAYDVSHRSPSSPLIAEQLSRAADALKLADVNHSGVLGKAELDAVGSQTAQRLALLASAPQEVGVTAAQLRQALKSSLGVEVSPEILKSRTVNGVPRVEIRASNGAVELPLRRAGAGFDIVSAKFTSKPTVVDPELKESFERQLHDDFGFVDPEVRAVGHAPSSAGVTRWHLQVTSGPSSARKSEQVQLEYGGAGTPSIGSFVYSADSAKEQALQLATEATLQLAREVGSTDALTQLEIFLKRDAVKPAQIHTVSLADSPFGFEPSHEVQFQVPALWGDNAGYATFDKKTGLGSADTFN